MLLAAAAFGIAGWGVFMAVITNQEKISSSVVKQIMRSVRDDAQLKEVLGEAIRPQPEWWLNGDPKINGKVRAQFSSLFPHGEPPRACSLGT
jgi:cytochrome c oxidase assembly factor 1